MDIFIANISFKVTSDNLKRLFAAFGEVSKANIVTDKISGKSKGFGFVTMVDDENAKRAIEGLNGKEFQGRELSVRVSEPKPERV